MIITINEYNRIYTVAHDYLMEARGTTFDACLFYSYFGAYVLSQYYDLDPKVKCGVACYHLGVDKLLCFGKYENGTIFATKHEFHAWVEVNGWLIDFMSPDFHQAMKVKGFIGSVESKMFQTKLNNASEDIDSMNSAGEFFIMHDCDVRDKLTNNIHPERFMAILSKCGERFKDRSYSTPLSLNGCW